MKIQLSPLHVLLLTAFQYDNAPSDLKFWRMCNQNGCVVIEIEESV